MADFNTPTQVKNYFKNTIVANHTELAHFVYGNHERLEKIFRNTIKKNEYVLFLEWPEKDYQDRQGSISTRLRPTISVLKSTNKDDFDAQDTAMDKCYEILNDIIIRMRREIFDNGHIFLIDEMGTIQPVFHMLIDNAFGVRVTIPMGDWVTTQKNAAKWSDIS